MPTYFLTTMGCQMNAHDSEKIAGMLEALGYTRASCGDEADFILFNTCCVRENPERKLYGRLTELRSVKAARPGVIIAVAGCMTQETGERSKLEASYPEVDLIFGTHNLHKLPEYLQRVLGGERVIEVWDDSDELLEGLPVHRESPLSAWVNVTYGCDNYCTYCIVPYVRGHCRSRRPESIVREVAEAVAGGVREVTLLGQNVNSYGLDLVSEGLDFAGLLTAVDAVTGLGRIRFTTSHPKDVSERLIGVLASGNKVCEHLHLPLQSGSSRVLARMNRGYSAGDYLALAERIRSEVPGISLTTDLIVGFPGETEADFQATLDMVQAVEFDSAFTFIYSPRQGTPAATFAGQVPDEIKKERIGRLIAAQTAISKARSEAEVGKVVEVLVEGVSRTNPAALAGRTRTNRMVHFLGNQALTGQLVQVKVTVAHTFTLYGELVPKRAGD